MKTKKIRKIKRIKGKKYQFNITCFVPSSISQSKADNSKLENKLDSVVKLAAKLIHK